MAVVELDRVTTPRGELALRQDGDHFEVISNGVFLMDTRNGESERLLVDAALARHPRPRRVLVGGLGVGFSLVAALTDDRVERVVVAEIEPVLVEWHRRHLVRLTGAALADERCELVVADVADLLYADRDGYDVICLDTDNGPDWTVTERNTALYDDTGTALVANRLRADGVLTVWSAARSPAYQRLLGRHFGQIEVIELPVPRGEPDVVFVATGRVSQTQGRDSDSS